MALHRFNALAAHTRSPAMAYIVEELTWFSDRDERLLGVITLDRADQDFAAVILGRDEGRRFRCIDFKVSFPTFDEAKAWAKNTIRWHLREDAKEFPQGEPVKGVDLFTPVVPLQKQHPDFVKLASDITFLPARSLINEIAPHFIDVDGNFVEQFQTTGFDARLWELYIFSYLNEEQLFLDRTHDWPDFLVKKYGESVAIEATIVGRHADNPPRFIKPPISALSDEEVQRRREGEMPIRFGSPLYSKLRKRYWDLPHMAGIPLVLAIADFHDDRSMQWSSPALIEYLYGVKHGHHYDADGRLIVEPAKIETHRFGDKVIPSGFFFQQDSENIAAVMFSATGTISKFNRLGRQAGFTPPGVIMIRRGVCHDHDPNASLPKQFSYRVTEASNETWAEGVSMFHNPNAKYPAPEHLFPSIAHYRFVDGRLMGTMPDFHPYASLTLNIKIKDK